MCNPVWYILWCCESEHQSGKCAKLHTVAASNNRDNSTRSLINVFVPLSCGCYSSCTSCSLHIQCHANGQVAKTSPFYNELHWLDTLFVKFSPSTTFTSWSQHHFAALGKAEQQVAKALHCGSKQQQRLHAMITIVLLLVRTTYIWVLFFVHIPFVVNCIVNAVPTKRWICVWLVIIWRFMSLICIFNLTEVQNALYGQKL